MSFGDMERGYGAVSSGAAPAFQASGRGGDQEYIRLNETVRGNVVRLSDAVSQYRKLAEQLGTPRDTAELRDKVYARVKKECQVKKDGGLRSLESAHAPLWLYVQNRATDMTSPRTSRSS